MSEIEAEMSSIAQVLVVTLVVLDCHPCVTCRMVPKRSLKFAQVAEGCRDCARSVPAVLGQ